MHWKIYIKNYHDCYKLFSHFFLFMIRIFIPFHNVKLSILKLGYGFGQIEWVCVDHFHGFLNCSPKRKRHTFSTFHTCAGLSNKFKQVIRELILLFLLMLIGVDNDFEIERWIKKNESLLIMMTVYPNIDLKKKKNTII